MNEFGREKEIITVNFQWGNITIGKQILHKI